MKVDTKLFGQCIENSEKVCWKVSELLPDEFNITLDNRFLPTSLTQENKLNELEEHEKLTLNQILGASYFNIFAFVEEYITLFTLNLASDYTFSESQKLRAFVRFSEEEIKHQILFRKYLKKFSDAFPVKCEFIGGAQEVASSILSNSKLCVLLLTYHLELITQQHYIDSVKEESNLDDKFKEILKSHWMEESQHAKLDLYKLREEASLLDEEDKIDSVGEYLNIIGAFNGLFKMQSEMNLQSLKKCFPDNKVICTETFEEKFMKTQLDSYLDIFVVAGFKNAKFIEELESISPHALKMINHEHDRQSLCG